MFIIPT